MPSVFQYFDTLTGQADNINSIPPSNQKITLEIDKLRMHME
jgi:hypothetical protein